MSDVQSATTPPPSDQTTQPTAPTTAQPLGNQPETRNPDGSIRDQQTAPESTSTTPDKSTTEPKADDKKPDPAAQTVGPPETYTFTAPEGYTVDPDFVAEVTPVLKELGVTQEGAAKLFDLVQAKMTSAQTEIFDHAEKVQADWRKEIATDRTLGNGRDGLSPETSANVAAALGHLPQDLVAPFKAAMDLTGAGNNPAFVRAMAHFGSSLREGKLVNGNSPSPLGQQRPGSPPRTAASAIFPNLPTSSTP